MPGGAQDLKALGLRMKALGAAGSLGAADLGAGFGAGKTLRAQLLAGIRTGAKPAVEAAREAARDRLPKSGGLNELVAGSQIKVATRLTGSRVGVRITDRGKGGRGTNRGTVRHPVFGRDRWVEQSIAQPGWFDQTLEKKKPEIVPYILAAMQVVADEATRRL